MTKTIYFVVCASLALVAFGEDGEKIEGNDASLRIVGNPSRFEAISKILTAVFVENQDLYKISEDLARLKPSYSFDVGIGIGRPKAVLHVSKNGDRTTKIIELYDKKDGLIYLRESSPGKDPSLELIKSVGWYQSPKVYELAEKELIRILREMAVATEAAK